MSTHCQVEVLQVCEMVHESLLVQPLDWQVHRAPQAALLPLPSGWQQNLLWSLQSGSVWHCLATHEPPLQYMEDDPHPASFVQLVQLLHAITLQLEAEQFAPEQPFAPVCWEPPHCPPLVSVMTCLNPPVHPSPAQVPSIGFCIVFWPEHS